MPEHYIRKQTLANAERYVTQELKDLEHTILTASDRYRHWNMSCFQLCVRKSPTPPAAFRKLPPRWPSWTLMLLWPL